MVQYKTVAVPITGVKAKAKDVRTIETANLALAPIAQAIENEARGGWMLHSITNFEAFVIRKKRFLEYIPIIGKLFRPRKNGGSLYDFTYTTLVFFKES
jgi:hypothetical protein